MKIAFLGDIAFFGKYSLGNNEIFNYFEDVSKMLEKFDYVVGNLETPFCNSNKKFGSKSAHLKSISKNIELLKYLNINMVNLANNHIFDYGKKGYEKTKEILEKNQISYFGIEDISRIVKHNNNKIKFSGYCCYSTNALGYKTSRKDIGINILNPFEIERDLIKSNKNGYLNILSFHFGEEHVHYPNYDHIRMSRKLAKKAPYILHGHHPHVIQGVEEINNSILAYSLGNFCMDDIYTNKSESPLIKQKEKNKKSFIMVLNIENNQVLDYKFIPIYMGEDKMHVGRHKNIIEELKEYSNFLDIDENQYRKKRSELLSNYINKRKEKRNINWYIKRLNLRSIFMILNTIKNRYKYKKLIKKYIN